MKQLALLSTIFFLCFNSFGQLNQKGNPIITNYTPETYNATPQNWAVVQDKRGVMYFGNNDEGVIEYDGVSWRSIPVPGKVNVRSLAVDTAGTVYVGTVGDFGYLAPDEKGEMQFNSLFQLVTDSLKENFTFVWKTYYYKGKVYFYSATYLFCYDGNTVQSIHIGPFDEYFNFLAFVVNNRFYIGSFKVGLREVVDTAVSLAPGTSFFEGKNIFSMQASSDSTALIVTNQGLFDYNQRTGNSKLLEHNNTFFKKALENDATPYGSIIMNDSNVGIGFILSEKYSFASLTPTGKPLELINKSNGLQDEFVTSLYQSKSNQGSSPLWFTLNSGLARVNIHSPYRVLDENAGLSGAINDIIEFNNTIFVASFSGVYYLTFNEDNLPYFQNIPEINIIPWKFSIFEDPVKKTKSLLVGSNGAVYEIDSKFNVLNINELEGFKGYKEYICYSIHQSHKNSSIVYLGIRGGLVKIEKQGNTWINHNVITSNKISGEIRTIAELENGDLWITTYQHGIKKISFNNDEVEVIDYGTDRGITDQKDNYVYNLKGRILFATKTGVKSFNPTTNQFEPTSLFNSSSQIITNEISRILPFNDGYIIAIVNEYGIKKTEYHSLTSDNEYNIFDIPFKPFAGMIPDAIFQDQKGILWIALASELYSYDPDVKRDYNEEFNALIRKVITQNGDSILFHGTFFDETSEGKRVVTLQQKPNQVPTLPFSLNNLIFEVGAPFYEYEELTQFSYLLEGNDKEWSKWEHNPQPKYTNISEGDYIFKVKARNVYGIESNIAEYQFSITPPWYRSIVALIAYVLLLAGFIWGIVVLNTRRLVAEKERLEEIVRERTAEVVAQKEEIESQRDKIFEQNEEIKSSINYASRIQNALLTPVETLNDMFNDYFILFLPRDIVSGDFYWQTKVGSRKICVVADCTGHGVPGGFMSMLGMGFLTQIVTRNEKLTASQILDQLRNQIIISLHQTGKSGESKDGMDLALYIIDEETGMLEFAGANNPLVLIRDNEVIQIKGDKMPIGIHIKCDTPFTNNEMEYKKGDVLYTFSDGYVDQFGGPDQRKFMIKKLKELLVEIHMKPMAEQREILHKTLVDWQGETPRIDDVVLMGVRL